MSGGQDWNGDEEEVPQPPPFLQALFSGVLNPEQMEQAKAGRAKNTAMGNLAYEALPAFALQRACPKCGERRKTPNTKYVAPEECLKETGDREAMCRQCRGCGYVWFERCLDAEVS